MFFQQQRHVASVLYFSN